MAPEDHFGCGDYGAMALHPDATCRDILLAGFLSGFVEELGEALLQLPQTDPVLQLARAAYLWAEERPAEALAALACVPAASVEAAPAARMRQAMAGTVTVMSLSGSPGGSETFESSLHRLRADAGTGLRLCTAGLREGNDIHLEYGQDLRPALAQQGVAPDLVYNVLEDAYLPPDFELLPCPRLTVLADMPHHILRRNGYYDRHDVLLAQSMVQHREASRMFGATTVYMPNADAIFEDLATQTPGTVKTVDFSYGGTLLNYIGRTKQRYLWPIVNGDLDRCILAYQGRFEGRTYEQLQDASRATASFADYPDFVTQPRSFEYLRKGAALVMPDCRFQRLILAPLGVDVRSVEEFSPADADLEWSRGGMPPHGASGGDSPAAPPGSGFAAGRERYRRLAARFGGRPADRPRNGRRSLRHTLALCLFHAARAAPRESRVAADPVGSWCPHYSGQDPVLDRVIESRLLSLQHSCETPAQFNDALLLNRRLLQARLVPDPAGAARGGPQIPGGPGRGGYSADELHAQASRLTAEAVDRYPDSSVVLIWYLVSRFGSSLPKVKPEHRQMLRALVDRKLQEERLRFLGKVAQPILDLGAVYDDRFIGVHGLAGRYMQQAAEEGRAAAEAALSQSLRRAALAYLCLVSAEVHRLDDKPELALPAFLQSLKWWHRHPSAYMPLLLLLRHWPMATVLRHVEAADILGIFQDLLHDVPEIIRTAGPDIVALCHEVGDAGRAETYAELWFRWLYRVVGADGPLYGPYAIIRIREHRQYWPDWVVERLSGSRGAGIRLAEEFVDYSGFENALRHGPAQ